MIQFSLRAKLSGSYIVVALFCVVLISIMANFFLEQQFRKYVQNTQTQQNRRLVSTISQQYVGPGRWKNSVVNDIGINALEQGMILRVRDRTGLVIWDATIHNNGLCQQMLAHMAQNMKSRYPGWKGRYTIHSYPIHRDFKLVGVLEIGYYGPFYYNDHDLDFINTLNRILFGVALLALILALMIGSLAAKWISAPLSWVIDTAQQISGGNYDAEKTFHTNIKEINQLTETVRELGATLQKQEVLRKRLTADVAHELRTPLATLQSHLEAMIDGIWQADPTRLKSCHEEIVRINRLVMDLGKLARFEGENLVLHVTHFTVAELVQPLLLNFEAEFLLRGVELEFTGDSEIVIYADRDKMSQVLINLIMNGLKFTPKGGKVRIQAQERGALVELIVSDTGCGINPEDLPYIFERFYRSDPSRNRMTGGAGIGLTIAKAIVTAHGGQISVTSEPGTGSEFTVRLPKPELPKERISYHEESV